MNTHPANEYFYTGGTHVQNVLNYHASEPQDGVDELHTNVAASALYDTAQIEDPAKCHPGTREAILRRLFAALDRRSADPDKPFVWLHGAAGAGKSAIARSLCEQLHAENQLLASFFFFRASPERNSAARLISTLTYQFRTTIPQLRPHIKKYIRHNPLIFTQSLDTQARHLLIDPIRRLHEEGKLSNVPPTAIVIDGLDECEGTENRRNVLRVLHTLQSKLPFPITILVVSRPNREIDTVFKDSPFEGHTIEELLNNECDVDADILKFYTDSFARIEKFHVRSPYFPHVDGAWPAPGVIRLLIKKTSGQFIFAKTVIRFVEPDRSDPDKRLQMVLGALPTLHRPFEQLDAMYKLVLSVIEPDQLETTLTVLGLFLCDFCPKVYTFPGLMDVYHLAPPEADAELVEWILDLETGQCQQFLVGLEALCTLSPGGYMGIFHKSFSDFLFDSSRSDQFHVAQDLIYERTLRSFISHHFYDSAFEPRVFMFMNMEFLFSNARITPELLSAIESVDFVASDHIVQHSQPPLRGGEFSWLRICDLFLRSLRNSPIPNRDQLAAPFSASLQTVATNHLRPYLDNPTLWPLLYIATRNNLLDLNIRLRLLRLVLHIPPHFLSLERTNGYHFSMSNLHDRHRELFVLYKTTGPLLDAARAALPEHQSPDSYLVTLLLKLVGQCIEGAIDPLFLVSSKLLDNVLRKTDAHDVLLSKLCIFSAIFKEQLDPPTITAIRRYDERCKRERDHFLSLWDLKDPFPILHRLTDDWNKLEDILAEPLSPDADPTSAHPTDGQDKPENITKAERVLLETEGGLEHHVSAVVPPDVPKLSPSPVVRRPAWFSPSLLYPIPIVLIVGLVLYRKRLSNQ